MTATSSAGEAVVPPFWPDRSSPVPLYFQVATHLEQAIMDGTIPPGTLFENEIALAQDMGLSRPTMRRSMQYLVDKGLSARRPDSSLDEPSTGRARDVRLSRARVHRSLRVAAPRRCALALCHTDHRRPHSPWWRGTPARRITRCCSSDDDTDQL